MCWVCPCFDCLSLSLKFAPKCACMFPAVEVDTRPYPLALFGIYAFHSLDNNMLCGIAPNGSGTFTLDAINAICEALTKSNIQSIRCLLSSYLIHARMHLSDLD